MEAFTSAQRRGGRYVRSGNRAVRLLAGSAFAGILLIIGGSFAMLAGLAGIINPDTFVVTKDNLLKVSTSHVGMVAPHRRSDRVLLGLRRVHGQRARANDRRDRGDRQHDLGVRVHATSTRSGASRSSSSTSRSSGRSRCTAVTSRRPSGWVRCRSRSRNPVSREAGRSPAHVRAGGAAVVVRRTPPRMAFRPTGRSAPIVADRTGQAAGSWKGRAVGRMGYEGGRHGRGGGSGGLRSAR